MNSVPPTQPTLLLRIRDAQDHEAWGRFVDLYAPLIYGFLRKQGVQDADALDLTQEVMKQISVAIRTFDYRPRSSNGTPLPSVPTDGERPVPGSFRGWLFTVVQNRLTDHWRAKAVREQGTGDSDAQQRLNELPQGDGAEASAEWDAEYQRQLFQYATNIVKQDFTDSTWQAFWQTAVDGRSGKDVAEELGLSIAAVYLAKGRVMSRLKEQVKLLVGEEGAWETSSRIANG